MEFSCFFCFFFFEFFLHSSKNWAGGDEKEIFEFEKTGLLFRRITPRDKRMTKNVSIKPTLALLNYSHQKNKKVSKKEKIIVYLHNSFLPSSENVDGNTNVKVHERIQIHRCVRIKI